MSGLTARLVEFTCEPNGTANDPTIVDAATAAVVDTVGVVLAGSASEVGAATHRYADGLVPARLQEQRLWTGAPAALPPDAAAMVASTLGHALDFDDALPGAGHPSSILLATIVSTPLDKLTGADLLDAFIVGFEVNARVASAVGHRHYLHGWHTTSTIGCFGAVAAACRLLRLHSAEVAHAYGIVASLAAGLQRNFGSFTKPLHSGIAARSGVLAAMLAHAGATADTAILDGERGFLEVYADGAARPESFDDLGQRWAIVDPGPTAKKYPCALEVYRAVDGVLALQREHGIDAAAITSLRCVVPPGTLGPLRYPRPVNEFQAKFSMPYALGAAAVEGTLGLASFSKEAIARPEVQRLMSCTNVIEDVACRPEDPTGRNSSASFGGFVDVELVTGSRSVRSRVYHPIGSPQRPLTETDRTTKFLDCAAFAGRDEAASRAVLAALRELAALPDVHRTLDRLTPTDSIPTRPGDRRALAHSAREGASNL